MARMSGAATVLFTAKGEPTLYLKLISLHDAASRRDFLINQKNIPIFCGILGCFSVRVKAII
jgi:hypothetical protein